MPWAADREPVLGHGVGVRELNVTEPDAGFAQAVEPIPAEEHSEGRQSGSSRSSVPYGT
jgi:hypothetical protein